MLAVPQHRHGVAERANLAQPVRDEDGGHALAALSLDDVAQPIDVAARQGRGRLVEQQDARLAEDGTGDLDLLLDREIEVFHIVVERDVGHSQRGEVARDEVACLASANSAERADGAVGQQHVVEDGKVADEGHFLEGCLDAAGMGSARRSQACFLAEDLEASGIRQDQTGEQFDDGRFAGAVLAKQRVHAAGRNGERHVVDRDGGTVDLANVLDGYRRSMTLLGRFIRHRAPSKPASRR